MPRKYKRSYTNNRKGNSYKPYTHYSEEILQIALQAVKDQTLTIGEAAKTYDVPKTTLWRKFKNKNCTQHKAGRPTLFTASEERCFIEHIKILSEWGFPFDLTDLRVFAQKYLEKIGKVVYGLKNNLPGIDWARYFLERYKDELSNRLSTNISSDRAKITPEIIDEFFENYIKTVEGVSPDCLINYDETNLTDDPGNKKYIYKRGTKYPERVINSSKTSVSLMFSGTAQGQLLPIYVVYKSDHLWDTWLEGGPEHTRYNRSKSGWFDMFACCACFEDWFFKVIVPYAKSKPGRKVIVGDNLSSHFSAAVLKTCEELNIAFVCLPPKTTHLLQPLDVAFYAPLKNYWRDILTRWKKLEGRKHKVLIKSCFPRLLAKLKNKLMEKGAESNNLKAGFNKTGLFPINPERPKSRLPRRTEDTPQEETYRVTSEVITNMLQELRGPVSEAPKRKKKCIVPPGKSITAEDLIPNINKTKKSSSKKKVTLVDYSSSDPEGNEIDSDVTFVQSGVSDSEMPCTIPGPSGLSKQKKKRKTTNNQTSKRRKIENKVTKQYRKGKGIGKKTKIGKENHPDNENAKKLNTKKITRRRNTTKKRRMSSKDSTSVSDNISIHSDSDIIDIPEDVNDDANENSNDNLDNYFENFSLFSAAKMRKYNIYEDETSESEIEDFNRNPRTMDIDPFYDSNMASKEKMTEIDKSKTIDPPTEVRPEVENSDTNDKIVHNELPCQINKTTNKTDYNLKTNTTDRLTVASNITTESTKTENYLCGALDNESEVHNMGNVESEGQHEEQIYFTDNYVLVRYYQRKKWVYYVGIIKTVRKENDSYYYSINFLKTIKKPNLKFVMTKKILDHDVVPQISIVKKVELKVNQMNPKDLLLSDDCDNFYFLE